MLHRIDADDIEEMPGPRFFAYCYRLTAYQGVVANAWRRQHAQRAAVRSAGPVSLADWAMRNPDAVEAAHQRLTGGR